MRCDDRDSLSPGSAHFQRLECLVEPHGRKHVGTALQVGERSPVADKELVRLPRIDGALESLQYRSEDVRHVIALVKILHRGAASTLCRRNRNALATRSRAS